MIWNPAIRETRRLKTKQVDMFDAPALEYKLVCDGRQPLTNMFVRTRKRQRCDLCPAPIAKGERVRRETRRSADGAKIETRYVCRECCALAADFIRSGGKTPPPETVRGH